MANVKAIPKGMHSLTAQLTVGDAAAAIDVYQRAFGAVEVSRAPDPSGRKIWHAELRIGDSPIFVNDAFPEMGSVANTTRLWLYGEDVDGAHTRAVGAGLKSKMPPTDMFWGDRIAQVIDAWGNDWTLAQRVKELSAAEMKEAEEKFVAAMKK